MPQRLLFVSGASAGGAFRSTLELADALRGRGHDVTVVVEDQSRPAARLGKRLYDLEARLENRPPARTVRWVRRRLARSGRPAGGGEQQYLRSALPENAAMRMLQTGPIDTVIVSSIRRPAWREIRRHAASSGARSVLYMRGVSELEQLTHHEAAPDVLLANTKSIGESAEMLGFTFTFVPSLVELKDVLVDSTRERVVMVGPTEIQGRATALELARRRPDVPFVFQLSWPITDADRSDLTDAIEHLANVTVRERVSPSSKIFADCRILLAPHTIDNRPRSILEAQANQIPVLASDYPGLRDQTGPGGTLVSPDASGDDWEQAFAELWDDEANYAAAAAAAGAHANRPEQNHEWILERFEEAIRG